MAKQRKEKKSQVNGVQQPEKHVEKDSEEAPVAVSSTELSVLRKSGGKLASIAPLFTKDSKYVASWIATHG